MQEGKHERERKIMKRGTEGREGKNEKGEIRMRANLMPFVDGSAYPG